MTTRKKKGGKPGKPGSPLPKRTKVIHNGQEYSISEAARLAGISRNAMYMRINVYDWTDEDAMVSETRPRKPGINAKLFLTVKTPDGPVRKHAKQWAEEMGGNTDTNLSRICTRKSRGWSDAQALGIDPPPPRSRKARPKPPRKSKPVKGPTHEQD